MNSTQIFEQIEAIASVSGKLAKEELIRDVQSNPHFQQVLLYALSPYITFGIGKFDPAPKTDGSATFDDDTWATLDALAIRDLSGNAARAAVEGIRATLEPKSRELFERILLKDLRAGISSSTVNKAIPDLVPTFDCMLAHKFTKYAADVDYPVYVEPKLDGVRVLAFVDPGKKAVSFYSRTGKEFTTFEHLKRPVLEMARKAADTLILQGIVTTRFVLDAEVVSGSFNATVSQVRKKGVQAADAKLFVFDVLPGEVFETSEKGGQGATYRVRRQHLVELLKHTDSGGPIVGVPAHEVSDEAMVWAFYERALARGLEGAIIKDPEGLYHRRRNKGWMKIKAEDSADVQVVGYYYGEAGKQFEHTLGGLIANFNGVMVNVGGGYTVKRDGKSRDEFIEAIVRDVQQLAETGHAVVANEKGEHFVQLLKGTTDMPVLEVLGRTIEVEYHEITPDGSLRHPRYKRFRDDKPVTEELAEEAEA